MKELAPIGTENPSGLVILSYTKRRVPRRPQYFTRGYQTQCKCGKIFFCAHTSFMDRKACTATCLYALRGTKEYSLAFLTVVYQAAYHMTRGAAFPPSKKAVARLVFDAIDDARDRVRQGRYLETWKAKQL